MQTMGSGLAIQHNPLERMTSGLNPLWIKARKMVMH